MGEPGITDASAAPQARDIEDVLFYGLECQSSELAVTPEPAHVRVIQETHKRFPLLRVSRGSVVDTKAALPAFEPNIDLADGRQTEKPAAKGIRLTWIPWLTAAGRQGHSCKR